MMSMRLRTCCGIDGAVRQNCAAVKVVKKSTIADVADAATHVFERSFVDTPYLIGLYCVADLWIAAGCCIEPDLHSARFLFLGMFALSTTGSSTAWRCTELGDKRGREDRSKLGTYSKTHL